MSELSALINDLHWPIVIGAWAWCVSTTLKALIALDNSL